MLAVVKILEAPVKAHYFIINNTEASRLGGFLIKESGVESYILEKDKVSLQKYLSLSCSPQLLIIANEIEHEVAQNGLQSGNLNPNI